jgi:hypothetical protein
VFPIPVQCFAEAVDGLVVVKIILAGVSSHQAQMSPADAEAYFLPMLQAKIAEAKQQGPRPQIAIAQQMPPAELRGNGGLPGGWIR